jgi:hypothetical protein
MYVSVRQYRTSDAADWVQANIAELIEAPPSVTNGEVLAST